MKELNPHLLKDALQAVGAELATRRGTARVEIIVSGGGAGLLAGVLSPSRVTTDCDVLSPRCGDAVWKELNAAAGIVATERGLAADWLNGRSQMWAWCLPLGWVERSELVGDFGPLRVRRISRFDLIASKVFGATKRPQDLDDLRTMGPTSEEIDRLVDHLERVRAEDTGRREFADEFRVLEVLRGLL